MECKIGVAASVDGGPAPEGTILVLTFTKVSEERVAESGREIDEARDNCASDGGDPKWACASEESTYQHLLADLPRSEFDDVSFRTGTVTVMADGEAVFAPGERVRAKWQALFDNGSGLLVSVSAEGAPSQPSLLIGP